MVFDCITDCIAWNVCDVETYRMLFKTDEMVAALFRNFFLAQVGGGELGSVLAHHVRIQLPSCQQALLPRHE